MSGSPLPPSARDPALTRNAAPVVDPAAPLQVVINVGSGHGDADASRLALETALTERGRTGNLLMTRPAHIPGVARQAAADARRLGTAVVAVGGDGTLNAVAQAAHDEGCVMGVVPQGTFNFFARTHGIPADPAEAAALLLQARPHPVQVALVNDRVFLVNASIGLYPELLEDRESFKARFGRSRLVAFGSMLATLLTNTRHLQIRIELENVTREVRTRTLFVGNNRLQFEKLGLSNPDRVGDGHVAAVMLRPIGAFAMLGLVARGAVGSLGEADAITSFTFQRMTVLPRRVRLRRHVKVAFDGEVVRMLLPLQFSVAATPLHLLKSDTVAAVAS